MQQRAAHKSYMGSFVAIFCWGEPKRKETNVPEASKRNYIYLSFCEVKIIWFLQAN